MLSTSELTEGRRDGPTDQAGFTHVPSLSKRRRAPCHAAYMVWWAAQESGAWQISDDDDHASGRTTDDERGGGVIAYRGGGQPWHGIIAVAFVALLLLNFFVVRGSSIADRWWCVLWELRRVFWRLFVWPFFVLSVLVLGDSQILDV